MSPSYNKTESEDHDDGWKNNIQKKKCENRKTQQKPKKLQQNNQHNNNKMSKTSSRNKMRANEGATQKNTYFYDSSKTAVFVSKTKKP